MNAIDIIRTLNETPLTSSRRRRRRRDDASVAQWRGLDRMEPRLLLSVSDLLITEINYNPADANTAIGEIDTGDNDDFEFIEIHNPTAQNVSLTTVRITDENAALNFSFAGSGITNLGPGEFALVVRNEAAFASRYGAGLPIAGEFPAGGLSNSGETVRLLDGNTDIVVVDYNDGGSWPKRADGGGSTLEFFDLDGNPDNSNNWRATTEVHGTPNAFGIGEREDIVINEILSNPVLPGPDKIELFNQTDAPIDIGGWLLSDDVTEPNKFIIPNGTVVPAMGFVVFDETQFNSTDGVDPRDFGLSGTNGDSVLLTETNGAGNPASFADEVTFGSSALGESFGLWPDQNGNFLPMAEQTFGQANTGPRIGPVVISEIMYNFNRTLPDDSLDDNLDFIELHNITNDPVDVGEWQFTSGVEYAIPAGTIIPANGFLVVVGFRPTIDVADLNNFRTTYGIDASVPIVGGWLSAGSRLNETGETLTLEKRQPDVPGENPGDPPIVPFTVIETVDYGVENPWPGRANGNGSSLERVNFTDDYTDPDTWRSSLSFHGSPGSLGVTSAPPVVINEVLAHTDGNPTDTIELHNTSNQAIDIGGWFLTDSNNQYDKFEIPADTMIPANGYITFNEFDFNNDPVNNPNAFALSESGERIWLTEGDGGEILSFVDNVQFGPTSNRVSVGRWLNGSGELFPMKELTLGAENTGPKIDSLIITEIHYNPLAPTPEELALDGTLTADDFEFIEIHNTQLGTFGLSETFGVAGTVGWKITGGVEFEFPGGATIGGLDNLVVLPFDPVANPGKLAAFKARYNMPDTVQIFGPYTGRLANGGEELLLEQPEQPNIETPAVVPYVLVDRVDYDDEAPWPTQADGEGLSIERDGADLFGDFGENWSAVLPSPGNLQRLADIDVQGDGNSIVSGDTTPSTIDDTDFGDASISGGMITHTFTIRNIGDGEVILNGGSLIAISGPAAGDFQVTAQPSGTINAGGVTLFDIQFTPKGIGLRQATVTIANTDVDENPYTFSIQGTGTGSAAEIDVLGNAVSIADGDTTPSAADGTRFGFNNVNGDTETHQFAITNLGNVDLMLTGAPFVQITGPDAADFSITTQPATGTLGQSDTVTFNVTFDPAEGGLTLRQATISIANSDADENPYTFDVSGSAVEEAPGHRFFPGGLSNAMQINANGITHFAYHDVTDGSLKAAIRDANGVWLSEVTVDNQSAEVGIYVAMALDSNGLPGLAYYDAFNGDLKYAKFDGANWTVEAVQTRRTVGLYPSIQFDASDNPNITYYNKSQGNLLFAVKQAGVWEITEIETQDDVGRYSSLQPNPSTGRWAVSYEVTTDGRFRYAEQTGVGTWDIVTVDPTLGGGGFTSLAFNPVTGNPAMTYYDAFNADLKYAERVGGNWQTHTVAAKRSQGLYTTLYFNGATANITYFNKTTDALVRASGPGTAGSWGFDTLANGGGRWARAIVLNDNSVAYSWWQSESQSVWFQTIV